MRWSLKVARIAGIDVRIHVTFFLLLAWFGYSRFMENRDPREALAAVGMLLALFSCVLLHEFGHAIAGRFFGVRTPDIILLPIGGVARMQRMPDQPWQEIVVALAGPAVNVLILAGLSFFFDVRTIVHVLVDQKLPHELLPILAYINLMLVVFNLLPAFPMDGGRVLRALLATQMRYGQATWIAAWIGRGFCLAFVAIAVLVPNNVFLLLIAFFIYIAGSQEADAAQIKDVAAGLRVEDAMITEFSVLPGSAVLDDAVELLLRTSQHEFPVVDDAGQIAGLLIRDDLIAASKKHGSRAPVAEFMRCGVPQVHPRDPLDVALRQMQECGCPALPVVDRSGRLTGLITPENVGELMVVHPLRLRDRAPAWRRRPPALPPPEP